ncbi:Solute carrier family 25 member 51 [Trichinella pseudospiralis]|uniref:Solute carrier family 25 member 51 n=1 Tax=Trichinella pseudospiralis TaxID=6337 RepID=A0A0V1JPS4_TRIPS|nr:Solute carrier family 25 member 51 [Trichinella pseudospiralis]KRY71654.1 Solute carrier family 25 member 51 [Trichinella pseudospiralis]KRZ31238.1 Solute carrier family 25 member 51 [Trichinella pseudospiralis]KRZ36969.1 Solute carrier family 25 member 51 [Trichinella pseudospiralis]
MSTNSKDFICGWGAALIETSCTYPFSKIVVRQQLLGLCVSEVFQQLKTEGTAHLYRGLLPPLLQRTSSRCIMFGMYDEYKRIFSCSASGSFTRCHAVAAFLAGCTEAVLCPFERVQTLLQSSKYYGQYKNALDVFLKLRRISVREYYRGLSAVVLRNGGSNVLFFALRDPLKEMFTSGTKHILRETNLNDSSHMKHIVGDLFTGLFLGAFISTVFFPINVMKTRMQASVGVPFTSIWSTFRIVFAERGYSVRKLYRGVHINYTRSMITWGITNAAYEFLERHLYHDHM